ncbi:major facilitator superfamily domain-containing protein [Clohesyomyces aquaticus]|uniref:Major facilitator superfamily domain-containing protein n=1 Tax=Clohesyomyces aquaticus TaxID=1231657 RepID=A0A1Y1ZH47_9PLEO|nr:major facilitator superfamily domain-containing protein [Clohesyomyces aquaticus]
MTNFQELLSSIRPGEKVVEPQSSSEELEVGQDDGPTVRKIRGIWWAIVITAIISSTFLYSLDNTVMANIRPDIVDSLGHMEMLPWISVSYPLGEVGTCPFWGGMYSRFDNKWLYFFTLLLFEVGSAIIGSAHSVEVLIFGRVMAGMGGSGIYLGTVNIISAMTSQAERAQNLGFIGVTWSLGTILGPIIGGTFSDSKATWRWAFYINVCIAAVAAPACLRFVPSIAPDTNKLSTRIKRIDIFGASLFAGGISTLIMILSFGGAIWPWNSGRMISLYVASTMIWILFALQQWRSLFTRHRIFPVELFANWEMCNFFVHTSLSISNTVVTVWTLPLFFQFIYGDSSLRSGLFVFAVSAAAIVAAGAGGAVFPKYTLYMIWFAVACGCVVIGNALLTTVSINTSRASICGYAAIQLFGCGLVVQLPFTVAQVKISPKHVRPVTSFLVTAQMAGVALSIGIATTIFVNRAAGDIARILPDLPRDAVYASLGGAGTPLVDGLPLRLQREVLAAIANNIGRVFYLNVASSVLGFLTSFLMKRERLQLES